MHSSRPAFVDPKALSRHLRRAKPARARFLVDAVQDEIHERLADVNRTFTDPALVTVFPALWDGFLPTAQRVAPTNTLALAPGQHDLVIHALALHWMNDPVGQIIQCARALRPDGLLLVACLGGETLCELRDVLGRAEAEITGGMSPRVAPMAEIRDLGQLLQRANLSLPVSDVVRQTVHYRDLPALAKDLRDMGETNALSDRLRRPTSRLVFARAETLYRADHATTDNRLKATFDLVFLTAWSPHSSQPQPLRPGSAKTRLATALNVPEFDASGEPTGREPHER